jgi:hypothetical protein
MTPIRRAAVLAALLAALVLASPASAQKRSLSSNSLKQIDLPPFEQRTDAFRRILFEFGFTPLTDFRQLNDDPARTVLIVLGDTRCLWRANFPRQTYPQGLRSFVARGGAVLVATDETIDKEARDNLVELAGVTVKGETLYCKPVRSDDVYRGEKYCPIVQPVADPWGSSDPASLSGALAAAVGAGSRPALFRDLRPGASADLRVATNAPSRLRMEGGSLPRGIRGLARLPARCVAEEDSWRSMSPMDRERQPDGPWRRALRGIMGEDETDGPLFAVGGAVGDGRVLVLADHSVFINRMILPRDTGNMEFTTNCLHWLRGGVTSPAELARAASRPGGLQTVMGQRDKVLFSDDGHIHNTFNVPLKSTPVALPPGSEPAVVAAVDQTLARLEDGDRLNEFLFDGLDSLPWSLIRLEQTALCLVTLALAVCILHRLFFRGRHRLDPAVPLLAREVARHLPAAPLLEQRRRAVLKAGNAWETARHLARQCFEAAGVPLSGALPRVRVTVAGGWWQRWRLVRRFRRLWRMACGDRPVRVPPAALPGLLRELEELRTALANGSIQRT